MIPSIFVQIGKGGLNSYLNYHYNNIYHLPFRVGNISIEREETRALTSSVISFHSLAGTSDLFQPRYTKPQNHVESLTTAMALGKGGASLTLSSIRVRLARVLEFGSLLKLKGQPWHGSLFVSKASIVVLFFQCADSCHLDFILSKDGSFNI